MNNSLNHRWLATAIALAWLSLWMWRTALEGNMAVHMTVQLPLLVVLGLALAMVVRPHEPRWLADADWLGIPGIVLVVFGTSFWMLPRALDSAISDPWIDIAKFISLPLLVGLPLGLSWSRMPSLGRAFIWANFIPKLGAIGGLYVGAPVRLCAYYRLDQQAAAGWTLIAIAVALGISWFLVVFIGWPQQQQLRRPALRNFSVGLSHRWGPRPISTSATISPIRCTKDASYRSKIAWLLCGRVELHAHGGTRIGHLSNRGRQLNRGVS